VGKPTSNQVEAYDISVAAEWATCEAMQPGVKVQEVHDAVKKFYEGRGHPYNRAFIGHALGIGCHEYPFLGPSHGDWVLEPGMFFQVEPSIALGDTRVHTEDSFVVTRDGSVNVSEYRDISELQVIR